MCVYACVCVSVCGFICFSHDRDIESPKATVMIKNASRDEWMHGILCGQVKK